MGPAIEEAKVPEDAIPTEDAAQIILEGVAEKKGIIIVPETQAEISGGNTANPLKLQRIIS